MGTAFYAAQMIHKKARPRRAPGEFGIEQTRDLAPVRAILEAAGLSIEGLEWHAACYLLAYQGDTPIGTAGIEPRVDAALLRSVAVDEPRRRHGVGEALVKAARVAAHTRGARTLYTLTPQSHLGWFRRLGFAPVTLGQLQGALAGTFLLGYLSDHQAVALNELIPLAIDIAADGVIER
jgi:N-acetylglutamate synthase-like GNAT family acetyltransferase